MRKSVIQCQVADTSEQPSWIAKRYPQSYHHCLKCSWDHSVDDKKKISIKDLLKTNVKKEVPTSCGPMYVRHLTYGDFRKIAETGAFERSDEHEIGTLAVQAFSSSTKDPGEWGGLSKEEFSQLNETDIDALAKAWFEESGVEITSDALASLGQKVLAQRSDMQQMSEKISDQFRSSYTFLKPGVIESLTSTVAAIDNSNQKFRDLFYNKSGSIEESPGIGAMARLFEAPQGLQRDAQELDLRPPKLNLSKSPEARAAKAAEKAAETLSSVAVHMGEMQTHVASLSTKLVLDVIPQWMDQQSQNKIQSEASLESAASSLRWTKWAVIASVVTSIGIALVQWGISARDGKEASLLSSKRQAEWQKQADTNQDLLRQQILESQRLRMELKELNTRLKKTENSVAQSSRRVSKINNKARKRL